ncbi:hypothetical protein L9F63_020348, partial [Diploptera punctata]
LIDDCCATVEVGSFSCSCLFTNIALYGLTFFLVVQNQLMIYDYNSFMRDTYSQLGTQLFFCIFELKMWHFKIYFVKHMAFCLLAPLSSNFSSVKTGTFEYTLCEHSLFCLYYTRICSCPGLISKHTFSLCSDNYLYPSVFFCFLRLIRRIIQKSMPQNLSLYLDFVIFSTSLYTWTTYLYNMLLLFLQAGFLPFFLYGPSNIFFLRFSFRMSTIT